MKRTAILCCALLLVACAPSDEQTTMEGATISLADVAGTWSMQALPEMGDSALVSYELVATDNTEGWTVTFPGRDALPLRVVAVDGDSVVTELGPYESMLQAGVMVTTRSVVRMRDGNLVGTFVAHYQTSGADSVLQGRQRGMRMEME